MIILFYFDTPFFVSYSEVENGNQRVEVVSGTAG